MILYNLQTKYLILNSLKPQRSALLKIYTHCFAEITVRLAAKNVILKKDNSELQAQIWKEKERAKRKRVMFKNVHIIYIEEIYNALVEYERITKLKKSKRKKARS